MKGSDINIMYVYKDVNAYEDIYSTRVNAAETCVGMEMENNKLVFTHLLLLCNTIVKMCTNVGYTLYLSSQLCKLNVIRKGYKADVVHGPCLSDKDGYFDFAYTFTSMFIGKQQTFDAVHGPCLSDKGLIDIAFALQSRQWISIANQWIARSNSSWPSSDVKSQILDHGFLFVPIGSKGSKNEHIEWRISFSVGEKLLIYYFTHTQLLC